MKKLITLLIFGLTTFLFIPDIKSQTVTSPLSLSQGEAKSFAGTTSDSLLAADTLVYYFQIKATDKVGSIFHLYYDETAGSQTVNVKVYESNDNKSYMYTEVPRGVGSKKWASAALTADTNIKFCSERDSITFNNRFYKIEAISSGASSKGTLRGVAKTYILNK